MEKYYVDKDIYVYPESYQKFVELNLVDFDVWYLIESEQATRRYHDLKERYPKRNLIPLLEEMTTMILRVLKLAKEVKFNLFMILLLKVLNKEKSLMIFGSGSKLL